MKFICSRCRKGLMFRQTSIVVEDWFLNEDSGELEELREQEQIDSHSYMVFCPYCDIYKESDSPENTRFIVDNCGAKEIK